MGISTTLYYLTVVVFILSLIAQLRVTSTFRKYSKTICKSGLTGYDLAIALLKKHNIGNIKVRRTKGKLTDHFDPMALEVRLSEEVYSSNSVAALGVAAHEIGHVLQHFNGFLPYRIRTAIFPVVSFGSRLAIPIFFMGLIFSARSFLLVGIILFLAIVLFQIITLPVEFNASQRALKELEEEHFLQSEELDMAGAVLKAAALTYVANTIGTVLQLLRLIAIARNGKK
ncbi:MAG: zinc metallopeptidase [Oscillospiraceae bacterium]|nr:zinc metallopeptidase [Oscillospiraceae bacterium]